MRRFAFAVLAFVLLPSAAMAQQAKADAEAVQDCVGKKSGPEGDLPSAGPLRDKFMAEMGDPQDCRGVIAKACETAGGDQDACLARESRAWLKAVADVGAGSSNKKAAAAWKAASSRIQSHSVALCEATAAMSAWGGETVKTKGKYGMSLSSPCVSEIVAREAIQMLTQVRGN